MTLLPILGLLIPEHLLFKGPNRWYAILKKKNLCSIDNEIVRTKITRNQRVKDPISTRKLTGSTEAAKLAIPNEMDQVYSDMGEGSMLILGMRERYTKWIFHQTGWNTGQN